MKNKVYFYKSRKLFYARHKAQTTRLCSDGYFRRAKALPTKILEPRGSQSISVLDRNELRRGLFFPPLPLNK